MRLTRTAIVGLLYMLLLPLAAATQTARSAAAIARRWSSAGPF